MNRSGPKKANNSQSTCRDWRSCLLDESPQLHGLGYTLDANLESRQAVADVFRRRSLMDLAVSAGYRRARALSLGKAMGNQTGNRSTAPVVCAEDLT